MFQNACHYIWHRSQRDTGLRAFSNRLKFGPDAPVPHERVWINPKLVTHRHKRPSDQTFPFGSRYAGCVRSGDWDLQLQAISRTKKHKACIAHFRNGLNWEETGIISHSLKRIEKIGRLDGMKTRDDVVARYAQLDQIMETVREERKLRPSSPSSKYEVGGILIHIGRDGNLIFGNEGFHRLAIAQILKLPIIPAGIGMVHPASLQSDTLANLRSTPHQSPA